MRSAKDAVLRGVWRYPMAHLASVDADTVEELREGLMCIWHDGVTMVTAELTSLAFGDSSSVVMKCRVPDTLDAGTQAVVVRPRVAVVNESELTGGLLVTRVASLASSSVPVQSRACHGKAHRG